MQSWILEILAIITNRAPWAHFFASQLAVVTAFWAIWQTGRQISDETTALMGALLLEGIAYYNMTSAEFNPDVLQLPFWALITLSYYKAIRRNRLSDWLSLGVWSAAGLYTKYSTALLLITFVLLTLAHPAARVRMKSVGPYASITIAALLFLPHLNWLINHNMLPLDYAMDRLHAAPPADATRMRECRHALSPLLWIGGQIGVLIPTILLALANCKNVSTANPCAPKRKASKRIFPSFQQIRRYATSQTFEQAFLNAASFGPFLLTLLIALATGSTIHDMWGSTFWNFIGLWLLMAIPAGEQEKTKTQTPTPNNVIAAPALKLKWIAILIPVTLIGYASVNLLTPYVSTVTKRINFPGQLLASSLSSAWQQKYATPLRYVVGDTWPAGNVAYYAPSHPHVFIYGNKLTQIRHQCA